MRFAIGLGSAGLDDCDPLPPVHDQVPAPDAALEKVFREQRAGLLRSIRRLATVEDAEDVIQTAFARCAERGNLGLVEYPGAYLRKAALNLLRTRHRAAARNPAGNCVSIDDVEVAGFDTVAALEARDRLRRLEAAVAKLKPLTRQIFLARRVHGYSLAEICTQTGLSQKGVERHMGIAIKKLGQHLHSHD